MRVASSPGLFVASLGFLILFQPALSGGESSSSSNLLQAGNHPSVWRLDQIEGGHAKIVADKPAVKFAITSVDEIPTHVQAFLGDLDLVEEHSYIVSCDLKASKNLNIILLATIDEDDWHGIGLHEDLHLTPDYQHFQFEFRVTGSVKRKNRIGFVLGKMPGVVWLKNLSLKERQ